MALLITAALIDGSMLYSVYKTQGRPKEAASQASLQGWVPGSGSRDANDSGQAREKD